MSDNFRQAVEKILPYIYLKDTKLCKVDCPKYENKLLRTFDFATKSCKDCITDRICAEVEKLAVDVGQMCHTETCKCSYCAAYRKCQAFIKEQTK